jgi:hypothetical protein
MAGRGGGLREGQYATLAPISHVRAYGSQVAPDLAPTTRNAGLVGARMLRLRAILVSWRRRAGHVSVGWRSDVGLRRLCEARTIAGSAWYMGLNKGRDSQLDLHAGIGTAPRDRNA